MHTKRLYKIYSSSLSEISDLNSIVTESDLTQTIESKKYDIQDQALIEAIINDKEKQLEESLREEDYKCGKYLTKKVIISKAPASEPSVMLHSSQVGI